MKNSKGFTLVELLSTIAILAIVLGIVSAAYVGITNHIKASFYKTLEESILVSGGEYYTYTKDRPEMFGDSKKVSLQYLVENKYITNIVDRKGNQCSLDIDNSYVGAYKDNYDKTNYYVCLTCNSDDYSSDKKECSGDIDYSLQMIATVNNTNKVYQVNNWVNNHVKLSFKTLNNINIVYVKDNSLGTSYNCTMSGNNIKSCNINVDKSGNYEYYGVSNDNKETKHGYINILVDKIKPSFDIYEDNTKITIDTVTKNINSDNIGINNIVRNIRDLDSKVQSIRYSFEKVGSNKNYITIDNNLTEFNINKNLGLGKYELIIEIKDYAGNINTRKITYQINKNVSVPDSSYCNDLTYNGYEQTLTKTPGEGYTFTNNKKTDAGSYEVTANLKENYSFSNGSTSAKFTCTIKRQPTATTGSCQSVTYNGYEQVIARGGSNVTYSNNLKTDAGTYTVTVNANSNYAFSDNSTSKTLNCTLNKKSVSVNWGNTTFTYNGGAQGPTASASSGISGETLNITRTTATNAGNYTSTASISSVSGGRANKNNYSLTGNTKAFTINKATPTVTFSATSGSVNAGSTITFTEKASIPGSFSNSSSNTSVATVNPTNYSNVSANTNKTVTITGVSNGTSTITVTFIPNDTTNYNNKTATYTVTGYKVASTGSCNNLTYNGSSQNLVSGGVGVNYSNNARTNQGSQTVTISLQSGYRWSDSTTANKTLNCSISKKAVTITANNQTITYGSSIGKTTENVTATGLLSGHSLTSITLNQSTTNVTTSGTITPSGAVIKSGTTDVTSNYSITYKNGTLVINRLKTATTGSCQSVTYNGGEQVIARGGSNVTYSNNLKTDAGTYTVTVNANSNYAFSDNSTSKTLSCTLNKKSVSVNWGNTTFTYNGSSQGPIASVSSGVSGETLNITRTTATNAGNYTSTASISSVSGGRANKNNYSLTGNTKAFTINKVTPTVTLSATSGSVNAGSTITFTEKASISGSFSNSSSNTSVATINPTNYSNVSANTNKTVTITGVSNGTSTITVTFIPNDTTNYNNITATYTVTGYKVASTGSCNNLTYNGSSQNLVSGGVGVNYSNNARTNQGSQTVTISLQSGYRWSDSTTANKTLNCSINKKSVSITAKNQNLNGTNTIDKSVNQITTSGLVSDHNVTSINLTQSTTSDTTNGTITPSNAVIKSGATDVTSNYSITYNKGNLTIVTVEYCANFYLNGSSKLDGVASDKIDVCCSPGNNTSCTIQSPSITPATDFDVLGWNTNSEATTSIYNSGASISLTKEDNQFYAITRSKSSTRKTKYLNFKLNGATSYTYNGTKYTSDQKISCLTNYVYNGDEIPDYCTITLPTIERTGGNAYGWDEDNNAQSATYNQGANYSIYDEITLNAITSRTITLTLDPNGGTTTIAPITGKAYNLDTGASFIIPSYDNANMCRTGTNYTKFSKGSFSADGYLNAYKYIGLTDDASSNTVKYCQGNYLYLEKDTTLYAIWNVNYATTRVTSGDNLNLRKGCGTSYGLTGASMNDSKTIYISRQGSAYSSGYMGYWVKYGDREGCASSKYLNNFTYPIYNSCDRTDYVCNGGTAADVTLTPSVVTLNLKKSDMLSKTINIDNRCGNITSTKSSNTSIATVSRAGNVITVTAVPGSVAENESKTATVTVQTEWDCSASSDVIVKNTNAVAPTIDISISGDSSTCSGSYIKGATATIRCSSNLVPITSFSSTGTTPTGDNNNQTSTVSLSTTGTKTITATCANSEGSTTVSKTVTIKVKSASSSCSCKTYSEKTVYGSWSGYTCKNPKPSSTSTTEWSCQKDPEATFCSSSKYYKCKSRTISKSTYCSVRNSCCHT